MPRPTRRCSTASPAAARRWSFLKLIERCLALGRRALVLVPEISLTPQMILRLKGRFGRRVAVQHSALNHTERLLQWQMIQDGGADIVVGTRSAIFAPLENIGLVIIDEEQEHTYRSESVAPLRRPRGGPAAGGGERGAAPPGQRHPQHRELLRRPAGPHPARPAHPALRRQPAAQRADRGYAGRAGGGQPPGDQPCDGGRHPAQPRRGQADHPAAQPPGLPDHGPVRRLPRGAQVPQVQRPHGLPQGGPQAALPLLRHPAGPAPQDLPRLRRKAALPGLRHPEGRGGTGGALPGGPGAADGSGLHRRQGRPRKAAGEVRPARVRHHGGDPDGGQGPRLSRM